MSDNPRYEREDAAILEALRFLEGDPAGDAVEGADAALVREYIEILGLLPAALEPEAPSPAARRRLLAAAAASRPPENAPREPGLTGEPPEPGVTPFRRSVPPPARVGARVARWSLAAAAVFALLLFGLVGLLYGRMEQQAATIATLNERLEMLTTYERETAALRRQLEEARTRMALASSHGVEICPLRPPATRAGGPSPPQPDARGVLYIAPDKRWYLRLDGLEPMSGDRTYQLWFLARGGAVSGGTFTVPADTTVQLDSKGLPEGMNGVAVTVEGESGGEQPSMDSMVLYGKDKMLLI